MLFHTLVCRSSYKEADIETITAPRVRVFSVVTNGVNVVEIELDVTEPACIDLLHDVGFAFLAISLFVLFFVTIYLDARVVHLEN